MYFLTNRYKNRNGRYTPCIKAYFIAFTNNCINQSSLIMYFSGFAVYPQINQHRQMHDIQLCYYTKCTTNIVLQSLNARYTSAVLRLECSIDCISGSVGHQQNIFR